MATNNLIENLKLKLEWYQKLERRLLNIEKGEETVGAYRMEVLRKVETLRGLTSSFDRQVRVGDIVSALDEEQGTLIMLRYYEGKSYSDIAASLNRSEEDVKSMLHQARHAMLEKMLDTKA